MEPALPRAEALPDAAAEERARFPHWRRNMISLFLANTLLTSGFGVSYPYLPLVLRELGLQGNLETWVGYTVGSFFLLSFFLTPVWGGFADHFGRKSMVLRAGLGMGLVTLAMSFASAPWLFITLFVAMGAANGFVPASLALVATNTPMRTMGKALSLLHTGALLGNTLGPVVGALLATLFPAYRYLFAVSGVFILAAGLLALLFAREVKEPAREPFRMHLIRNLVILGRIRGMADLYGLNFLFSLSFFGSTAVVSVYTLRLVEQMPAPPAVPPFIGVEAFWVGAVAMAMAVASAMALPFWGRVLDRFETSRVLALGFLVGAAGSIPVVLARTPLELALARLLFGSLACGIAPALVTYMKALSPPGMDARTLSYGTSFGMLGTGAGPFLGGLIGPIYGLRSYFALNGLLLLLGFLAWMRIGFRHDSGGTAG